MIRASAGSRYSWRPQGRSVSVCVRLLGAAHVPGPWGRPPSTKAVMPPVSDPPPGLTLLSGRSQQSCPLSRPSISTLLQSPLCHVRSHSHRVWGLRRGRLCGLPTSTSRQLSDGDPGWGWMPDKSCHQERQACLAGPRLAFVISQKHPFRGLPFCEPGPPQL